MGFKRMSKNKMGEREQVLSKLREVVDDAKNRIKGQIDAN